MEQAPKTPIEEIIAVNEKIEGMVGNNDLEPEHMNDALREAREVYDKYKGMTGDENTDEALGILKYTIENTEDMEDEILGKFKERVGGTEEEI